VRKASATKPQVRISTLGYATAPSEGDHPSDLHGLGSIEGSKADTSAFSRLPFTSTTIDLRAPLCLMS